MNCNEKLLDYLWNFVSFGHLQAKIHTIELRRHKFDSLWRKIKLKKSKTKEG